MIGLLEQLFRRFLKAMFFRNDTLPRVCELSIVTQAGSQHLGRGGRRIINLHILGYPGTHREVQASQNYIVRVCLKNRVETE